MCFCFWLAGGKRLEEKGIYQSLILNSPAQYKYLSIVLNVSQKSQIFKNTAPQKKLHVSFVLEGKSLQFYSAKKL